MRCVLALGHQPALAGVKHLSRLENVLARAEWNDPSIAEGLLCDADDNAIGGTMTNLFIAANGALATPSLARCGVAGVTRDRVLDAARRHGVACAVRDIPWADVLAADEVILTNSLAGAWPVREIDGRMFEAGPLARSVQRWLESDDEESA
jgi:4-amino-4-deoxychorismate lyase